MEEEHNRNSKILARFGTLRCPSSLFTGGGHIIWSLGEALYNITNTIFNAEGALYNIISHRDFERKYYSIGLSYKDVKKLKMTKYQLFSLF